MKLLKFIVAGVGPGDPELITVKALKTIEKADVILTPHSKDGKASIAEQIVRSHLKDIKTMPIVFPMVSDGEKRDEILRSQLSETKELWKEAETVVLPVIGDSALYATSSYLYDVWKEFVPELELGLIPGISAHSLAASRASVFLAMGEDILSIIPGTDSPQHIKDALAKADSAALYKPCALKDGLREAVTESGPWKRMVRIDRAGLEDEKIYEGESALEPAQEYLSILLLWR